MLLWRFYQWRRRRAGEQLRQRLGLGTAEWQVITRLAKRLSVPPETALRMLIGDGLRLRAASFASAVDIGQSGREEMPIARMGKAMLSWATQTPNQELHLIQRTDGLHGIIPTADEDSPTRSVQFSIPRNVVESLLAELRYSCGTDVLSEDIEVRGDILLKEEDKDFRIKATFPPSGREDGLRAILRATPA